MWDTQMELKTRFEIRVRIWGNLCDKILEGKLITAADPAFEPVCISILPRYTENFTTIGHTVFLLWFSEVQKMAKIEGFGVP